MGDGRNSYSKTDPDATFMRMQEDHMPNGQLKPAYNVQIAVNSEYITGIAAYSNRTDSGTLIPFLQKMEYNQNPKYEKIAADAGYESEENYLYLDAHGQMSFIKPVNYDYAKSKRFKEKIGRQENMKYDDIEDCYYCANNRKLSLSRELSYVTKEDYVKTTAYYRCQSCEACPYKENCFQSKRFDTKLLKVKRDLIALRTQSLTNITTPEGIVLRINRSIQVEGAFGVIKHDRQFKRFLTRGKKGISAELYLLALSYNLNKLYAKCRADRLQTHLFDKMIA